MALRMLLLVTVCSAPSAYSLEVPHAEWVSIRDMGAKGDSITVYDAAIKSGMTVLTSSSARFTAEDIGKIGVISTWDPTFHYQSCTIKEVIDAHSARVDEASHTFVRAEFQWGTDDTAAINAAERSLTKGGVLYIPPGIYMMSAGGLQLTHSNVTVRGSNNAASILTTNVPRQIVQTNPRSSSPIVGSVIEDLGFDGHFIAVNEILLKGSAVVTPVVRNCRLIRSGNQYIGTDADGTRIEANEFDGYGTLTGTAVAVSRASRVEVRGNRIRYTYNGITVAAPSGQVAEDLLIENNIIDLGWYLGPTAGSGSGESVTYTAKGLTDVNARFPKLKEFTPIRVLSRRAEGVAAASESGLLSEISDAKAAFTSSVNPGDLVVMGGAIGLVSNVADPSHLQVEEWLDRKTKLPIAPSYGAYVVYRIILGRYATGGSTGKTLATLDGWHDWFGNALTPPAGTMYEVQTGVGNYPIHLEPGARNVKITGNIVKRGYSDEISFYGTYGLIANNLLSDGQDMGITVNGNHQIVTGNKIWHSGAGGIWVDCSYSTIAANLVSASTWMNFQNTSSLADIMVFTNVKGTVLADNICDGVSNVAPWPPGIHRYGITLVSEGTISGNSIHGNRCYNHTVADIQLSGPGVFGNDIWGNEGTINAVNHATFTGLSH